jgi:hypothetical protein
MVAVNRTGAINRGQRATPYPIPAPVGGWNQRDPLATMKPQYAVIMDNWFPTPYDVGIRAGCTAWSTGLPANVTTLVPYTSGSTAKMFGVSAGAIYDCSLQGPVGAALVSGLSTTPFQQSQIGTAGGQFALLVNGVDTLQLYNGQGWASIGNGNALPTISGITATGTTATATTSAAHNFAPGQVITLAGYAPSAYNGSFTILQCPTTTTFTFALASAAGNATTIGTLTFQGQVLISSMTAAGTTATVTTNVAHGLAVGQQITISGATPSAYNGTFTVLTTPSTTTFTYVANSAPGGSASVQGYLTYTGITGVLTSNLNNICLFKQRLWFAQKNSLVGWFLPVESIGGALSQYDFSAFFTLGGYISNFATWTLDAGYGLDDYFVIISSRGEVLVYKGTDPTQVSTWSMVGRYFVGAPMSQRATIKYAGDVLLINRDGLVPLSQALQSSRIEVAEALSDTIQAAISAATTNYAGNFGWEIAIFPTQNMVLVNIPVSSTISYQYVMNSISKAWCRFKGWTAYTFALFNDQLYYGGAGAVYSAYTGTSDNGSTIVSECLQAFNYLGERDTFKQLTMVRPLLSWNTPPALNLGCNTDFDQTAPTGVITPSSVPIALWDGAQAKWDAPTAIWNGDVSAQKGWQTSFGAGYCFGLHMLAATNGNNLRWSSTDYLFVPGGIL